jgi:hypothetical protein
MAAAAERGSPRIPGLAGDRVARRAAGAPPGAPAPSTTPTGEANRPGSGRNPPRSTCLAFDTTGGCGQMALEGDEDEPFFEEPGDSFVITRELPEVDDPAEMAAVFQRYEDELSRLLSEEALSSVIEAETSPRAVRWVVRVPHSWCCRHA